MLPASPMPAVKRSRLVVVSEILGVVPPCAAGGQGAPMVGQQACSRRTAGSAHSMTGQLCSGLLCVKSYLHASPPGVAEALPEGSALSATAAESRRGSSRGSPPPSRAVSHRAGPSRGAQAPCPCSQQARVAGINVTLVPAADTRQAGRVQRTQEHGSGFAQQQSQCTAVAPAVPACTLAPDARRWAPHSTLDSPRPAVQSPLVSAMAGRLRHVPLATLCPVWQPRHVKSNP